MFVFRDIRIELSINKPLQLNWNRILSQDFPAHVADNLFSSLFTNENLFIKSVSSIFNFC